MNEYWFFKDDCSRVYIKKENGWHFLDEEEEFEQLIDSLNLKGIREKKLHENLKKIKPSLKLKKGKKASATKENEDDSEMAVDAKKQEQEDESASEDKPKKLSDKNHLFENDEYEQTIINAVWYNKTMPKKRKGADLGISRNTRGNRAAAQQLSEDKEPPMVTLESMKN